MEDLIRSVFLHSPPIPQYKDIIKNQDLEELFQVTPYEIKEHDYVPTIEIFNKNRAKGTLADLQDDDDDDDDDDDNDDGDEDSSKSGKKFNAAIKTLLLKNETFISQFSTIKERDVNVDQSVLSSLKTFAKEAGPMNRYTWRILTKLNVPSHKYSQQYIHADGRDILLTGNSGGDRKVIDFKTNMSAMKKNIPCTPEKTLKRISVRKLYKRGLWTTDFNLKPGPLCKKAKLNENTLDTSLGGIELVTIPAVGLEITPKIGAPLDPNICRHLKSIRDSSGFIDASWAEFASSTLKSNTLNEARSLYTFSIPFENNQNRILMRRDVDASRRMWKKCVKSDVCRSSPSDLDIPLEFLDNYIPRNDNDKCCKSILSDLIDAVCVGEFQDNIYQTEEEDTLSKIDEDASPDGKTIGKKRGRKRLANELRKLNVTIIDIDMNEKENCQEEFCKLGCICNSLNMRYSLNDHCGFSECMFKCKCKIDDKCISDLSNPDNVVGLSPSVVFNLHNQMNKNLSKEERKFHCTFVVSKDQTISLSDKRRGVKFPRKYEDYAITDENIKKYNLYSDFRVVLPQLPSVIKAEPWCMFHQLYRCFCKNTYPVTSTKKYRFSEIYSQKMVEKIINTTESIRIRNDKLEVKKSTESIPIRNDECKLDDCTCARTTFDPDLMRKIRKKSSAYKEKYRMYRNGNSSNETILEENEEASPPKSDERKSDASSSNENTLNLTEANVTMSNSTMKKSNQENFIEKILKPDELVKFLADNKNIIPYVNEEYFCISLRYLISNFILQKIHIWLTVHKPYLQFITLENKISCKHECVNIINASRNLMELHPPYVKEIIQLHLVSDFFVVLFGKTFAWQIFATCSRKEDEKSLQERVDAVSAMSILSKKDSKSDPEKTKQIKNTNVKKIPIKTVKLTKPQPLNPSLKNDNIQSQAKNTEGNTKTTENSPIQNLTLHGKDSKDKTKIEKMEIFQEQRRKGTIHKMNQKKYWFIIFISGDFSMISVERKNFYVQTNNIYSGLNEAYRNKQFIWIPTQVQNVDSKPFGIYIPPCPPMNPFVFLGPYDLFEPLDLKLKFGVGIRPSGSEIKTQTMGKWFDSKYKEFNEILNMLATGLACTISTPNCRMFSLSSVQKYEETYFECYDKKINIQQMVLDTVDNCTSGSVIPLVQMQPKYSYSYMNYYLNSIYAERKNATRPPTVSKILVGNKLKNHQETTSKSVDKNATDNESDDDVILIPDVREILEISDSE